MIFCGHRHDVACFPTAFFRPTVGKGEPTVVFGEKDRYDGRMAVHHGFLTWTILHPEHAHAVILGLDGVVLRIDSNGICRDWLRCRGRRHIRLLGSLHKGPEGYPGKAQAYSS